MDRGFIVFYRKTTEWEWYKTPNMFHLFSHLIFKANHQDAFWQGTEIKRGQLITSVRILSSETGISEQSIRTCIKRLISTHELTSKSTNKYSLLTIEKYDTYQMTIKAINKQTNKQPNKELTNNQQTTNKQLTTNNNDNNDKQLNNDNNKKALPTFDQLKQIYKDTAYKIFKERKVTINNFNLEFYADEFSFYWLGTPENPGAWFTEKKFKTRNPDTIRTASNNIIKYNFDKIANYDIPYEESKPEPTPEQLKKEAEAKEKVKQIMNNLKQKYKNDDIQGSKIISDPDTINNFAENFGR